MYFPHRDASEPDYWPPPFDKDYTYDFRPPLIAKEIWYIKFAMVYSSTHEINIWWRNMNGMPPSYLPLLVSQDGDSFNLFAQTYLTHDFPSGIHRWQFSVEPGYYDSIKIMPRELVLSAGDSADFNMYLYHFSDSNVCVSANFSFIGSGGSIDSSGRFSAMFPGSGIVIASQGGDSDTANVTIVPASDFDVPLVVGWNLISLPCEPASYSLADIMPSYAGNIFSYDNSAGLYLDTDSLFPGNGYFVLSSRDTIISITGTPIDSISTPVGIGWNLVGATSYISHFDDFFSTPSGILRYYPWIWDWAYFEVDSILPYQGFWILCAGDGAIRIVTD